MSVDFLIWDICFSYPSLCYLSSCYLPLTHSLLSASFRFGSPEVSLPITLRSTEHGTSGIFQNPNLRDPWRLPLQLLTLTFVGLTIFRSTLRKSGLRTGKRVGSFGVPVGTGWIMSFVLRTGNLFDSVFPESGSLCSELFPIS